MNAPAAEACWTDVCAAADVAPGSGVRALVDGTAVAVIRHDDGSLFAVDDADPATGASVLARGLTGTWTVDGERVPTVASPLHKQRYDLRTGRCLDRDDLVVGTWAVRERSGRVEVGGRGVIPG